MRTLVERVSGQEPRKAKLTPMEEAALWPCDLSITVPDRELPGEASKRADVDLSTSLSRPRDQDTEDGTALFLLQTLLKRG